MSTADHYWDLLTDQPVMATFSLLEHLLREYPVLDLGCGVGHYLRRLPPGSIGLDASRPNVARCRAAGLKAFLADLNQRLPVADEAFRAVLASHVLEHVESPLALLRECRRVLIPGGRLILGLPVEGSLVRLFDPYYGAHPGHLYAFSTEGIAVLLQRAGFTAPRIILEPPLAVRLHAGAGLLAGFQRLPLAVRWPLSTAYWAVATAH